MTTFERNAKNAKISAMLVALMGAGMPVRDAVDAVLGAGTYEKLAGDVYDMIRARAAEGGAR